ncbi:hypothetical protein [Streptomyces sp. NPDC058108]|uniref:hypothetical protein n=1 Tax=Streptomyces sp. NPDC058108 TaxID=3346344 RepID=UPI0036E37D15
MAHTADVAPTVPALDTRPTGRLPYLVAEADKAARIAAQIQAAGRWVATNAYEEALRGPNPLGTLDAMLDGLHEVSPELARVITDAPSAEFAEGLRAATADRLWAFTAIERARAEMGDGYGYLADFLIESVKRGGDPTAARQAAIDAPGRIRSNAEKTGA